ncbi:hypothetical protein NLJ89_g12013 [Agrocybe chaxingu]|uniref:Uncharacterized protein n=1 Tax=Agrocybe chaxingu TaxID=84603 RepID=A0A9W8MMJ0_9AGAR|nr:hypothetical protein NLJ89_g12013 [Agrocybe chaxingu]
MLNIPPKEEKPSEIGLELELEVKGEWPGSISAGPRNPPPLYPYSTENLVPSAGPSATYVKIRRTIRTPAMGSQHWELGFIDVAEETKDARGQRTSIIIISSDEDDI